MLLKVEGQTHLMHLCDMTISSTLYHNGKSRELDKQSIVVMIPSVAL